MKIGMFLLTIALLAVMKILNYTIVEKMEIILKHIVVLFAVLIGLIGINFKISKYKLRMCMEDLVRIFGMVLRNDRIF